MKIRPTSVPEVERLRRGRHRVIDRDVRQRGEQAARHDDLLTSDSIRERAEDDEERRAEQQRERHDLVGGVERNLEHRLQEDQRVELSRVPHDRLSRRRAEQHDEEHLPPLGGAVAVRDRRLRRLPLRLEPREERRLGHAQRECSTTRRPGRPRAGTESASPTSLKSASDIACLVTRMTISETNSPSVAVV